MLKVTSDMLDFLDRNSLDISEYKDRNHYYLSDEVNFTLPKIDNALYSQKRDYNLLSKMLAAEKIKA